MENLLRDDANGKAVFSAAAIPRETALKLCWLQLFFNNFRQMGGLDLGVCFRTKKHEESSTCQYKERDNYVEALIRELFVLCESSSSKYCEDSSEDSSEDPIVYAKDLNESLDAFEKTQFMQLFKDDWPQTILTDDESLALIDKVEHFFLGLDDKSQCKACRRNTFALASAASISVQVLADYYDVSMRTGDVKSEQSAYFDALDDRIHALNQRATYIQSRTAEIYYGTAVAQ